MGEPIDWAIRYQPIIDLLSPSAGTILDAGSGSAGLGHFVPGRPIVAVDLAFRDPPSAGLGGIRGSLLELPFCDRAFESVVASDVFEHLRPVDRPRAFRELSRVCSGQVILGFPDGDGARADDEWLDRQLRRLRLPRPGWLLEHLALDHLTAAEIVALAPPGSRVETTTNANRRLHRFILLLGTTPLVGDLLSRGRWVNVVRRLRRPVNAGRTYRSLVVVDLGASREAPHVRS